MWTELQWVARGQSGTRAPLLLCLLQVVWVAASASQPVMPTDFSAARERMVEELSAPARGIKNRLVLNAMNAVAGVVC